MIKNLTEGKPEKVLFLFTLPMLLGNIFQQLYNLADSVIVGKIVGPNGLAAVGSSFPISFLAIGIAIGASQGCSIIISQCYGAKDYEKMRKGFSTSLIFIIALSVVIWIASIFFLEPLMHLLKTPSDIFDESLSYIRIIFIGCIFTFGYNCLAAIFNALGNSKVPLLFLILSTILNIFLDIIFVWLLKLGVNGAAYATLISQIISAISLFIYFLINVKKMNFKEEAVKLFDLSIFKNMIKIAIPSMIQQSMVSIGMMAIQGLVNSFGTNMVAGYTAATKIDSIAIMPNLNIGIAISSFTAQNLGAKITKRVNQGYIAAIKMILIISVAISVLILLFGKYFVSAFMDTNLSSEAIAYGIEYLKIVSNFYFLFGIMCITNGVLRGAGDMRFFMTATLINIAARIAFAYILTPFIGYHSVFWSLPLGWGLAGLIAFIRYKSGKWKNKAIL